MFQGNQFQRTRLALKEVEWFLVDPSTSLKASESQTSRSRSIAKVEFLILISFADFQQVISEN